MAPVKPMGTEQNPLGQGVGFPQKYNEEEAPVQELNPAVVVDATDAPKPRAAAKVAAPKAPKAKK